MEVAFNICIHTHIYLYTQVHAHEHTHTCIALYVLYIMSTHDNAQNLLQSSSRDRISHGYSVLKIQLCLYQRDMGLILAVVNENIRHVSVLLIIINNACSMNGKCPNNKK